MLKVGKNWVKDCTNRKGRMKGGKKKYGIKRHIDGGRIFAGGVQLELYGINTLRVKKQQGSEIIVRTNSLNIWRTFGWMP